jgi:NADP-dependent 3-hydroxy acid dehydrogenase YdfG
MQISGSTVLLTGATGGIGHAIARELHARGAELILTGRRTEILEPLAAELGARALAIDLSDSSEVERLAVEAGEIDILVANAALPASGRLETYTQEQIDRALDVNLRAPILLAHAGADTCCSCLPCRARPPRPAPRCTAHRSSGYVASPWACARTCTGAG